MTHRRPLAAALSALALALAACNVGGATYVVQRYPGAVRPAQEISVLRVNGADSLQLVALDGDEIRVPVQSDARLHFELLPGRHSIVIGDGVPFSACEE